MKKLISLLSGIVLILALVLVLTYRKELKQHAVDYVTAHIEKETGYRFECKEVHFSFPLSIHVDSIHVSEKEKSLLHAKDIDLHLTPLKILKGLSIVDKIRIKSCHLVSLPKSSDADPFSWASLANDIFIKNALIENFSVDPSILQEFNLIKYAEIISQESPLRISGHFFIHPKRKKGTIDLTLSKGEEGIHLDATLEQKGEELIAQIDWSETEKSFVSQRLELPLGYSYHANINATAPIKDLHRLRTSRTLPELKGDFKFSYRASKLQDHHNILLGQQGSLKGKINLKPDFYMECLDLEGTIGAFSLHGNFAVTPELTFDRAEMQIVLNDPKAVPEAWGITVENAILFCQMSGDIKWPNASFEFTSSELNIPGRQFLSPEIKGQLLTGSEMISGTFSLSCLYQDQLLQASGALNWNYLNNVIGLSHFQLNGGLTHLSAEDLHINLNNHFISGHISGNTDARDILTLSKKGVAGTLLFDARLYSEVPEASPNDNPIQIVEITTSADELQIAEVKMDHVSLEATLEDIKHPSGICHFSCGKINYRDFDIEDLSAETVVNLDAVYSPFSLSCKQGMLQMQSKGSWHRSENALEFSIDILEGTFEAFPFALQDSVKLQLAPNFIELSPFFFTLGEGSVYAAIDSSSGMMHAISRVQDISMDLLSPFIPTLPLKGSISGALSLTDTPTGLTGDIQLDFMNVNGTKEPFIMPQAYRATVTAILENHTLQCSGEVLGFSPFPVTLSATIPLAIEIAPFSVIMDPEQEISALVSAEGKIESLIELFLPITSIHLTGITKGSLAIQGTMQNPNITGSITLSDGTFEVYDIGTKFHHVNSRIVLNGNQMSIMNLEGLSEKGSIHGSGTAEINLIQGVSYQLNLQLDHVALNPYSYATMALSGPLRFSGNMDKGALEGHLVMNDLNIIMPEKKPELTHTVNVKYINQPPGEEDPIQYHLNNTEWPLDYNLTLELQNGIIRGQDWRSDWEGHALVTGDTEALEVNGTFNIVKGEYNFNGKVFEINQGAISFAGDPEKKTTIYVIASKDIETNHIEVILKGDINHPAIAFRSDPAMSQREILSWILFERGTSDITSFQGTQLNESITNLMESNSKPDLLTKIRNRIGIDKINISQKDDGETSDVSLQVGKYISRGVLLSIHKGITSETNRLAIEADFLKNFKVQAEVGDDADGQLRLKWKKDY